VPRTLPPPVRTSRRRAVAAAGAALLLAACTADPPADEAAAPTSAPPTTAAATPAPEPRTGAPDASRVEVLATGLRAPWGLAFLPDGDALVTERDTARVLRVPAAGGPPQEVTTLAGVDSAGEGGLLGIAVQPGTDWVWAYLTADRDNRVVRFRLDAPQEVEPVLTGIPKGRTHNGGRIVFGPDGDLYVGTGDAGDADASQDPDSLGGKVLQLGFADGEPVGAEVLTLGHRNVQGLAFDGAGRLLATEFGQNRFDEVNVLEAGRNYGWPVVEGPGDGGGRFAAPLLVWDPSEASPSGAAVVGDDLYVAALRGQRLWRVPVGGGEPEALLQGEYGRLRHAERAPDGSLWVLTSNRDGRGDPAADDDRVLRLPAT
jgi:glucose/arabinose dehydrogenase